MERSRNIVRSAVKWLHPKNTDQNLVSALIHMLSVSLLSMSLVELKWFEISTATQGVCAPFLSMTQFFTYGYTTGTGGGDDGQAAPIDVCLNSTTVNMMRIIILLSFMAIIFSLCGFYIEIVSPRGGVYVFIRKYALISTCTVLWIMAMIASCYYVAILVEESFLREFPVSDISVTYGYGFYLVAVTGGLNLLGTFFSLLFMHNTVLYYQHAAAGLGNILHSSDMSQSLSHHDDSYLITTETISGSDAVLPPPYNVPPPPYHP